MHTNHARAVEGRWAHWLERQPRTSEIKKTNFIIKKLYQRDACEWLACEGRDEEERCQLNSSADPKLSVRFRI